MVTVRGCFFGLSAPVGADFQGSGNGRRRRRPALGWLDVAMGYYSLAVGQVGYAGAREGLWEGLAAILCRSGWRGNLAGHFESMSLALRMVMRYSAKQAADRAAGTMRMAR